jgi:hypothetical protein
MFNSIKKHQFLLGYLAAIFIVFNCSKNDDDKTSIGFKEEIDFVKTFGGSLNESAQSIIKTNDGGYAVLGYTQSMHGDVINKTNESFDYWLLKFDQNNALQWQKTYGGTDDDRGSAVIQTADNGYAVLGYSKSLDGDVSENAGANDFWVSKLDTTGTISWQKSFGFSGADNGISLIQTNDGGYLLTGVLDVSASNGEGNSKSVLSKKHAGGDYWAIKLNTSGEKQWSKFYGGTFTDTPYDVIQTEDNGYLIIGSTDSNDVDINNNKGSYDFWIVKISETGTLVWEKSFGGSEIDEARAITKSNDGNYIIVGDTRSNDLDVSDNNGAADLWVIKISTTGSLIWEKSFGGTSFDVGRSISKTQDGGFIISGSSRSADVDVSKNNGQNDAWILKIDANANLKWQKTIGGSEIDFAYDAVELDDKTIIVVGESNSSNFDISTNKGFTDLLIFKIK